MAGELVGIVWLKNKASVPLLSVSSSSAPLQKQPLLTSKPHSHISFPVNGPLLINSTIQAMGSNRVHILKIKYRFLFHWHHVNTERARSVKIKETMLKCVCVCLYETKVIFTTKLVKVIKFVSDCHLYAHLTQQTDYSITVTSRRIYGNERRSLLDCALPNCMVLDVETETAFSVCGGPGLP